MLISAINKEMRLLCRDLHGVAVLFMMPVLFMFIMSAALSDDNQINQQAKMVLLGQQNDDFNQQFSQVLKQQHFLITLDNIDELKKYQRQLQQNQIDLLIVNVNQQDTPLADIQPLQLWINPRFDPARLLAIKGALQRYYIQQRITDYLQDNHIQLANNQQEQIKQIEQQVNQQLIQKFNHITYYLSSEVWQDIYLNAQGEQIHKPNSVQHSVPAWLIFGMFFILIPLSNVMTMERQTNTITRLAMAQASAWQLIMAKFIPYFMINQCQFMGMVGLGYFVLPLLDMPTFSLVGSFRDYLLLSSCISLAALGYGLLISVIARTTEQAVVLGGGGIIIMAAIGGIMVPTYIMPEMMQMLAHFSPMGWALIAFQDLLLNQYSLAQIQFYLYLLMTFGLVCLMIAVFIYQYQLKTQVRF
ncbi:ABC transporter permease [Volucribacter amazonae]|uniref:ABC transporter n=1 Tax=Volucribacter amazonae TaxID=256731 RepID=A0A9X4SKX3_9PAST|nr:ABC transporter permease [Volucribacter amazonae]MDG6894478.1 ABC transporter [Volucribacter amazonae]